MNRLLIFALILSLGHVAGAQMDGIEPPYLKENVDTLETWQGVKYYKVLENPDGKMAEKGDKVYVFYRGYFEDGHVFDQNFGDPRPFVFKYKKMEVINGWDFAMGYFKAGEKGRLIIPWKHAYGRLGQQPNIPGKADLIFDIHIVGIE